MLAENLKQIQKKVFDKSKRLLDRHLKTMYCDCTNYYFEISEEDSFRRYGPSQGTPSQPIVGMVLMMDKDGLPVACDLYPGNESEQPTLMPLEKRLESQFGLSQVYRLYRCRALERGQAYLQQQRQAPVRVHGVLEEPKEDLLFKGSSLLMVGSISASP